MEQSYLLTDQERDRFVWWLTQEAKTAKDMVTQLKELKVPSQLIQREDLYIAACLVLINKLTTSESMTIEG
jgi:hypothetical protein